MPTTNQTEGHTLKSFDQELQHLSSLIVQMGGAAEAQVRAAVQAVARRDPDLAAKVMEGDARIDGYQEQVDAQTVRMLALRQPVASDLREILAALKIAGDLERIGDYAKNIAKRSISLSQTEVVKPVSGIVRMGDLVMSALADVVVAYVEQDVEKALSAWRRDVELDELYTSVFREMLTYMMEDSRSITPCIHLLFIAKNLERIGDHATNVAETVHFHKVGRPPEGARPKGDESSFVTGAAGD
ncbi:MAG TPA: phosphate signaling complex protein PhoU [Azospirillum sp.]